MELLIGGTGDGKTKLATLRIFHHLDRGGVAACNYHLRDGWAWRMALRSYDYTIAHKPLHDVARSFHQRMFLCGSPNTMENLSSLAKRLVDGPVAKQFDRHSLVVLDEGHFYIASDKYRDNAPWLRIFNQQRKMKLHCLLLTNDPSFLDSKVRKLFKVVHRCINLHEHWRIPGTTIAWPRPDWRPNIPRPSYVVRRWSTLTKRGTRSSYYRDQTWLNDVYDTDEIFDAASLPATLEPQGFLGDCPPDLRFRGCELKKKAEYVRQRDQDGSYTIYDFCSGGNGLPIAP